MKNNSSAEIKRWKRISNDFPEELEVKNKVYKGEEVLASFAVSAYY